MKIVASNDLDEHLIASLKEQGARIDTWGVGTRLVTGGDQAALGGVYKLGAVREPGGAWRHKVKVSEQAAKTSNPGVQQVRRYSGPDGFVADVIYDEETGLGDAPVVVDPLDPTRRKHIAAGTPFEDLLRARRARRPRGVRGSPARGGSGARARAGRLGCTPGSGASSTRTSTPSGSRSSCTSSRRAWCSRPEGCCSRGPGLAATQRAAHLSRSQRDDAARPARARGDAAVPARVLRQPLEPALVRPARARRGRGRARPGGLADRRGPGRDRVHGERQRVGQHGAARRFREGARGAPPRRRHGRRAPRRAQQREGARRGGRLGRDRARRRGRAPRPRRPAREARGLGHGRRR